MSAYEPPTPEQIRGIAQAYFQERAGKALAVDEPTLIFVGGQPGAGKTAAANLIRAELQHCGGFIHVDADRLRERIDLRGGRPSSEQTQVAAGALAGALRAMALSGRRNLVEEGTFRNAEGLRPLVERIQAAGYRVELLAVATPLVESRLGIYQRFEAQHAHGVSNPRFIPDRYHDESASGFANTVAKLEDTFDRVRVVNRAGEPRYDSQSTMQPGRAIDALTREQTIGDERLTQVVASWAIVHALAEGRGADAQYLRAVGQHRDASLQYQTSRREFEHALDNNGVRADIRAVLRSAFENDARTRFAVPAPTHDIARDVRSVVLPVQRDRQSDGPER